MSNPRFEFFVARFCWKQEDHMQYEFTVLCVLHQIAAPSCPLLYALPNLRINSSFMFHVQDYLTLTLLVAFKPVTSMVLG